ncbi:hypothetical protein ACO0LV_09535 [Pseudactinotalea sp. Z1739]
MADIDDEAAWTGILARHPVLPDTRHRFLAESAPGDPRRGEVLG